MGIFKKIQRRIIGDLLEETPDFYDKSRILLTYNLSAILILLIAPITIFLFSVGLVINGIVALIAVISLSMVIILLKYTKNIVLSSSIYAVFSVIILVVSYAPQTNS